MTSPPNIVVAALYRFARFDAPQKLRAPLLRLCERHGVKGTILLAHEGINGTIAGANDAIDRVIEHIRALPGCAELDVKYSGANQMPFYRMKLRVKKEIVTMGVADIDPSREAGHYIQAKDWNEFISDSNVILIDTRNDYEVNIGSFAGAIDPKTKSFRDFPKWFRENRAALTETRENPKFAMFCTGGIRCEKSTAFLRAEGIDEVYHLEGGILRYLETIPAEQSKWRGECFVFDERVSVKHGLEPGSYELCHACRLPLSAEDRASDKYVEGVACPQCHEKRSQEDKARFAERQKQIALAKARGQAHIGAKINAK